MNRGIWLAILLAGTAQAADPQTSRARGKTSAEASRDKSKKKPPGKTPAGSASAARDAQKTPAAADPAKRAELMRAKSLYMFAVDACDRPDRCDAALRDNTESRFMEACLVCASQERCDAERAAIKDGSAHRSKDPCAE